MNRREAVLAAASLACGASAFAQGKPLKIVVPYSAGGGADNIGRMYGEALGKILRRPVVVENRAGAAGAIGAQAVAGSPADGSTLLVAPTAVLVVTPNLKPVPYEAKEFVPVAKLTTWLPLMIVRKDFPGASFAETIEEIRRNPGRYSFGSAGLGTMSHLMGELMNQRLNLKTVHVPYKGSADEIADLIGGRIDITYDAAPVPQVKAGALKAVACMVETRNPELPQVKTLKELGVELNNPNWYGVFAPKGTPREVVQALDEASKAAVAGFDATGLSAISMGSSYASAADFKAQIGRDDALMREVIAKANIKLE